MSFVLVMPLSYINKLLTKEEFISKAYKKGKSKGFENFTNSVLNDLDRFCDYVYHKKIEQVMIDLKKDLDSTNNPDYALKFLQDYIDWLEVDHADILIKWNKHQKEGKPIKKKTPLAIHNYVSRVRKYLKMCGGIRIDDSDYADYLTFPADENDEEVEPFLKSELKLILDSISNPRRKAMGYFMKDTRCRILETMRIKKKYFDLTTDPVAVNLPKSILKNKKMKRTAYLTKETEPKIRQLLKNLNDEDLVFTDNQNDLLARDNEESVWRRLVIKNDFTEKYQNGRLKKNLHSIGAFCITQIKEATKDPDYAHGYGGHTRYLQQYIRLSDERKIELFRQSEPYLTLSETIHIETDQSKELQEIKEKFDKYKILDEILDNLDQPKLEALLKNET
jgi:integrase